MTTVDEHAVRIDKDSPVLVVWAAGDPFDGENAEPTTAELPWHAPSATAVDVFGKPAPVGVLDGKIRVHRTVTPAFITV